MGAITCTDKVVDMLFKCLTSFFLVLLSSSNKEFHNDWLISSNQILPMSRKCFMTLFFVGASKCPHCSKYSLSCWRFRFDIPFQHAFCQYLHNALNLKLLIHGNKRCRRCNNFTPIVGLSPLSTWLLVSEVVNLIFAIIIRLKRRRRIKVHLDPFLCPGTGRIVTLHESLLSDRSFHILKGQTMVFYLVIILKVHAMVFAIIIIKFCWFPLCMVCTRVVPMMGNPKWGRWMELN